MRRTRRSVAVLVLVLALGTLAACTTRVAGQAVGRPAPSGPSSVRPTPRPAPVTTTPAPTTRVRPTDTGVGLPAVCDVLARSVPPTVDDLNAFVDSLDDASAARAASSVRATVAELVAALGTPPGTSELAMTVLDLDEALGRVAASIVDDDPGAFNDAIDDVDTSYASATVLCRYT